MASKSTKNTINARLESLEKAVVGLTAVVAELVKLHQMPAPKVKAKAKAEPKAKAAPKAKAEPKAKAKPKPKAKPEPKPTVVIPTDKYVGLPGFHQLKKDCVKAGVTVEKGDNKVALLAKLQKAQKPAGKGKKSK